MTRAELGVSERSRAVSAREQTDPVERLHALSSLADQLARERGRAEGYLDAEGRLREATDGEALYDPEETYARYARVRAVLLADEQDTLRAVAQRVAEARVRRPQPRAAERRQARRDRAEYVRAQVRSAELPAAEEARLFARIDARFERPERVDVVRSEEELNPPSLCDHDSGEAHDSARVWRAGR